MSTLSDLRARDAAEPRAGLPERSYPLCIAQRLVAEAQTLEERRDALVLEHARGKNATADGGEQKLRPRRAAERAVPPEVDDINSRLEKLFEEMREHTGTLLLRGKETGEWLRWVQENPPDPDSKLDQVVTYGTCDSEALFESLEGYVAAWNGEPLAGDDWAWIKSKAAPGDLQELCRVVVQMHTATGVTAPPKLPSSSPGAPSGSNDSDSPGSSGSRRSGSSGGSRPSGKTTTTPKDS